MDDPELLHDYRDIRGISVDGLGGMTEVVGVGSLRVRTELRDGPTVDIVIDDVFYIKGCGANIISSRLFLLQTGDSIKKFVQPNHSCPYLKLHDKSRIDLQIHNDAVTWKVSCRKPSDERLDRLSKRVRSSFESIASRFMSYDTVKSVKVKDINYAHLVLCHASKSKMEFILANNLISGLSWERSELNDCYPCAIGKAKLGPYRVSTRKYSRRGELVVSDVEGPISVPAFKGYRYAIHFTDMYSRFSAVYFMESRTEVASCLQQYIDDHCIPNGVTVEAILRRTGLDPYRGTVVCLNTLGANKRNARRVKQNMGPMVVRTLTTTGTQ